MERSIEIFFCYAREDEVLRQGLEKQLQALRRQGIINLWHDRKISPGAEWEHEIDQHLKTARVVLLLISSDFIDSDYCYGIEMKQAMERHKRGESRVIPIILRPVYWQKTPFGKLQALPTDAIPVTSSKWHTQDEAFFDVAEGIRIAVEELIARDKAGPRGFLPKFQVDKIPNERVLINAYEQIKAGKITSPDIIRRTAADFQRFASDPKASRTTSFDFARAAEVLFAVAARYEEQSSAE